MRLEEAEPGLRARAAHGEGAHLLGVNEGVAAVLPTPCHAAHSTHGSTQAACRVGWGTSKFEGPENPREGMRDEMPTTEDAIVDRLEA